jgi:hypothetical protein
MVKKKRKASKKHKHSVKTLMPKVEKHIIKHESDVRVEKVLIENFVALQKVMANLSTKFEDLSVNLKKLLDLFEVAAKSFAKEGPEVQSTKKEAENIMKKLDNLADQNKILARGLTLIHEKNPPVIKENYPPQQNPSQQRIVPQAMTQPKAISSEQIGVDLGGYQKSISEI